MESRVFLVCIVFSFTFPSTISKTFSLNDAIAAEEKYKSPIKLSSSGSFLSSDRLQAFEAHRQNIRDIGKSLSTTLFSPLKYRNPFRKPFQIKSPLKPKAFKRPRKGLKIESPTQQAKRHLQHEDINEDYIPIFKSLSIILDNILEPDSHEGIVPRNKYKRTNGNRLETNDVVCNCALRSTTEANLPDPYQEAAAAATFISTEVETESPSPAITTAKTNPFAHHNIGNIRRNQNVPALPPRNTSGIGRNDSGVHEGRSTPNIRNDERSIAGNNRYYEHDTGVRNISSDTENSEEDTNNDTRYSPSSVEPRGGFRGGDGTFSRDADGKTYTIDEQIDAPVNFKGNVPRYEEKIELANRTIQTESPIPLSKLTTRLQRIEPHKPEAIQPKGEKDYAAIERFISSAKQIFNRNSQNSSINKRSSKPNETIVKKDSPHNKGIMIFDGYSVARDVNGENKMSEKAIEIRT
ncbi:uncharacterized protein LOC123711245 [Pieris brassicae]|uniref:Uncharacterized protein n=1 Tax=Pieris brassicae TaxID=7116 RepID=A0A9P0TMW2_PIEBR|nr:uncharacterized protein LOC123711245 [Pieris brassicae]CAH4031532.1 unnamed protein product [Pieris brassicae]